MDFPAPPLAGDPARVVRVQTEDGPVRVIGLEDLLVDRLNAAVRWKDTEAKEWYVTMPAVHPDLDDAYLDRRASEEGMAAALAEVRAEAERVRGEADRPAEDWRPTTARLQWKAGVPKGRASGLRGGRVVPQALEKPAQQLL